MSKQTVLMTRHKGVDLHAETAGGVLTERVAGGESLVALHRCECFTWWEAESDLAMADVLDVGRYYNPNKHSYGHFELSEGGDPWYRREACAGQPLPADWPGRAVGSDLAVDPALLFDHLLGGPVPAGNAAVDVLTFPLGDTRPLLSGVLWRLVLDSGDNDTLARAERLICTRGIEEGLLVNPHMQGWLLAQRQAT